MIINHLAKAYDKIAKNQDSEISGNGFSFEKVPFIVVLNINGELIDIIANINTIKNETKVEKLPERIQRTGVEPNFLCDTLTYVFGLEVIKEEINLTEQDINEEKNKTKTEKVLRQTDKAKKSFEKFKKKILEDLESVNSACATAIKNFYNNWVPDIENEFFYEIKDDGTKKLKDLSAGIIIFALNSVAQKSIDDSEILSQWKKISFNDVETENLAQCCISGEENVEVARIHNSIRGLKGAQSVGASIVSFNEQAFESYNKKQSFNGPISVGVMKKYTAALNYLLRKESKNKTTFGNDTLVFWAESLTEETTDDLLDLMGVGATKEKDQEVESKVVSTLKQIKKGEKPDFFETPDDMPYHLLLLSPNAARIAIRRYYNTTFGELKDNIMQHYFDMELFSGKEKDKIISFWQILDATVPSVISKRDFNPNYFGALTNSVFNNLHYPNEILGAMIARFKTDNPNVEDSGLKKAKLISLSYRRAAFIKAYLTRKDRKNNKEKEVLKMSLNKDITNEAYLLGRLFAVMEKVQQAAIPGINATIKDRFFASACSTPATAFPVLLTGYQNHIAKLEGKTHTWYEKMFDEIFSKLSDSFTKQLDLDGQGRFIIGYYQQRADLWKKQETSNKEEN